MGENTNKRSQGATEYLLILAAVLVIVAIAVYYVSRGAGYPAVSVTPTADNTTSNIKINVESGSIAANEWEWAINTTKGATPTWETGTELLDAPSVNLESYVDGTGYAQSDNTTYYVSLRHKSSLHVYFTDTAVGT